MGVVYGMVIVGDMSQVHQINRVDCVRPAPPPHTEEEVCPGYETECAGLDFAVGGSVHSFRDYHVISFGSYVANTGDIEGRLAARNDVTFGNGYTVGFELRTFGNQPDRSLDYSLVVGRDLHWGSGSLHPDGTGIPYAGEREDAFVGRTVSANTAEYLKSRVSGACAEGSEGCLETEFNDAKSCYEGYQSTLASLNDNVGKHIEWSALVLTCSDSMADQYVVSITDEEFSQFTYYTVSGCNFQASWVINVRGTGRVNLSGGEFPAVPGGVVWNVVGSGRVISVTGIEIHGHILAPNNILLQEGGVILGKVVVGDVQFALQINKIYCPQPGEVVLNVPVSTDAPSGSPDIETLTPALQAGDAISIGNKKYTVIGASGTTVTITPPLVNSVAAGTKVTATVDGKKGRNPGADEMENASSLISVSFALLAALLLALF